jgi:hypothetical protein
MHYVHKNIFTLRTEHHTLLATLSSLRGGNVPHGTTEKREVTLTNYVYTPLQTVVPTLILFICSLTNVLYPLLLEVTE